MVHIKHTLKNPYAVYGLKHFLFKYGIPAELNSEKIADIEINYNSLDKGGGKINILIFPNDLKKNITGYLRTNDDTTPLFELPKELSYESGIASFQNRDNSYPCIFIDSNTLIIGFDIFNEIGSILSGHLNHLFDKQNDEIKKLMKTPVVDILEKILFDSLQKLCQENDVKLDHKPFWPDKKKFAVCLTHDVDRVHKTYQYLPSIVRDIKRMNFSGILKQIKSMLFEHGENNPYWNFNKIMELENKHVVKSTFFFLDESGKLNVFSFKSWILFAGRYRIDDPLITEIIKKLHKNGFEIGVHGSYNSYNDLKLLKKEKDKLANIINNKIYGIRQHHLNFDENTFNLYEKVGFEYDTTVGFQRGSGIGFKQGTCFPYQPLNPDTKEEISLLEIPLVIMDTSLLSIEDKLSKCLEVINIVEKYNGVLVLLWHSNVFNDDYPEFADFYEKIIKEAKKRNAWIVPCNDVARWLKIRNEN